MAAVGRSRNRRAMWIPSARGRASRWARWSTARRSEEHTSELQSQSNLVCRLLLEKKKLGGGDEAHRTAVGDFVEIDLEFLRRMGRERARAPGGASRGPAALTHGAPPPCRGPVPRTGGTAPSARAPPP